MEVCPNKLYKIYYILETKNGNINLILFIFLYINKKKWKAN